MDKNQKTMVMDKCVSCGDTTPYSVNEHIDYRNYYIEGAGQLCKECYEKIYIKEKADNELYQD